MGGSNPKTSCVWAGGGGVVGGAECKGGEGEGFLPKTIQQAARVGGP